MSDVYVRTEPLDALVVDGEAILLLPPDRVVRLSPIATVVFGLTATAVALDALASVVEERFGPPTNGTTSDALRAILDDLHSAGVLERVPRV